MAKPKTEKKNIKSVEVKVFDTKISRSGSTRIRIVDWISDTGTYRRLEKRTFRGTDGKEIMRKAQGFTLDDVKIILENHLEICELLEQNPAFAKIHDEEINKPEDAGISF